MALSPYPICMDVICETVKYRTSFDQSYYSHRRYYYVIESLQEWISKGKIGTRKMSLEYKDMLSEDYYPDWLPKIMEFSEL